MIAVPAETPVTMPVPEPIVAIPVAPLVQLPPAVPSVRVVVLPVHTDNVPPIATGAVFTVTVVVTRQPPATV